MAWEKRAPAATDSVERNGKGGAVGSGATWLEGVGGVVPGRQRHQPGIDVSGWHGATPLSVTSARQGRAGG
jgi:hypothetical protein